MERDEDAQAMAGGCSWTRPWANIVYILCETEMLLIIPPHLALAIFVKVAHIVMCILFVRYNECAWA